MAQGTVVSIGTFDGVHRGHQAILGELRRQAEKHGMRSVAYAFSVPPRWVMQNGEDGYLLLPADTKLGMLHKLVDVVQPAHFETVRFMDPEDFVETVLLKQLNARVVVEGESFRFGCNRSGNLRTLEELGSQLGFEVVGVPSVMVDNTAVSSTRIRESIRTGDFRTARDCLGRPPVLSGTVVPGDQLGSELGAPTANLAIDPHILLPRSGIFLVHVYVGDVLSTGLLYIGRRPTLGHGVSRCEVHILDFPRRSLYGERLETHLLERIRDDRAFPSLDTLRAQIESDITAARRLAPSYPMSEKRIVS